MMAFFQQVLHRVEQTVIRLEGRHWAVFTILLVVLGYMFLRKGHA
ncbi:MAG TPA: hypothetical protein VIY86_14070 [Pirellulaceae bacterium]